MQTLKSKSKLLCSLATFALITAVPSVAWADPCSDTTNGGSKADPTAVQNCVTSTPIWNDINTIINFLSAGVGIIVTGVIILGGIQYIMAGGNPQALTAARQRITNGLIALFIFLFVFAFLQWLIPGGIFK